jgi:hypothetical protein
MAKDPAEQQRTDAERIAPSGSGKLDQQAPTSRSAERGPQEPSDAGNQGISNRPQKMETAGAGQATASGESNVEQ